MEEKETIQLDRKQIIDAIRKGDNCDGNYILAIRPNGNWRIHWAQNQRAWNPWASDAEIIAIPALFPDGHGEESELAKDLLKNFRRYEAAKRLASIRDSSIVEIVEEFYPEEWEEWQENGADWLADAFLAACNGDGADLNDPNPWGIATYEYLEAMGRNPTYSNPTEKFEFEWA